MDGSEHGNLILRFYDPKRPDAQTAPVSALAQSFDALQRLVFLTAMRREGRTPGRRARPSTDLQVRYRLVCDLPTRGSYICPVRIQGTDLLSPAEAAAVMGDVQGLFAAIGAEDVNSFTTAIPDETWRRFMLEALERVAPPPITGIELEIHRDGHPLIDTVRARPFIERLARATTRRAIRGSVVGEFIRIDFAKQEITIRHQETGRLLSCVYEAHVEESLLDHPRDLLLVFGTVTRNAEGQPISIEDVHHIEPVNLDPIIIHPVLAGNERIAPTEALSTSVSFDESLSVYVACVSTLNISVFAETREMLNFALEDEIALLWKRYASAPDEKLTLAARALKQRVLRAFSASNAT